MKPSTSTVALGLLLTLSAPCRLAVAADPGEQILLDRAAYWRAQQRPEMAAGMLAKVLALNPNQPDALYQLGMLATQRGDQAEANVYFARLRQMAASDPRAAELLSAATVASVSAKPTPRGLPELDAVSADSDDLTPSRTRTPSLPAPGRAGSGQRAADVQLASLSQGTISDGNGDIPATAERARQTASGDLGAVAPAVQTAQLELLPPPPVNGYQYSAGATSYLPSDTLEMDIDRNLAQLMQQTSPTLEAGLGFRWHDGTSGLNQLYELGGPIEASFSPWYTGTARIDVLPVYLDAGSLATSNLSQFGVNPMLIAHGLAAISPRDQNAAGVGLLGGYSYGDFSGRFGTTPLGFPVTNLVGMAAYAPKFLDNTLTVRFEGLRQPVTDSVLSYAGTHTSVTTANATTAGAFGPTGTWGGVVKTGGNISAFYDDTVYGAYAGFGMATVTGHNVQDNSQMDGLIGAYFRPYKTDNNALRVGISFYYTGFDKNLSGFTFGQGGYFSPQNFEALTFPVEFTGHNGPWTYLAAAAVGVQHFNSDRTAIFPNNLNAEVALATSPGAIAFQSGTSSTGPAFNVKGQLEYAIDDSTSLGAAVTFDNGNNYNEVIARLYLRKTFDWLSPTASSADPAAIARRDVPQSRL